MLVNLLIAGFGGQGVLFTGKIVAYTGMIEEKQVSWLPSYGPEMRGGTANCSVCIDDEPIGSPIVLEPDLFVAMNAPSFEKFIDNVRPGGIVVYDSSLIENTSKRTDITFVPIPATSLIAEEQLDGLGNIVILGRTLAASPFTSLEVLTEAMKKCVPASKSHLLEPNIKALNLGYNYTE